MTIPGYSKVYRIEKPEAQALFPGTVLVEEKVDGSQISFGKINGELIIRSKNDIIDQGNHDKMFNIAVEQIKKLDLPEGVVFRAEYLQKPKHNVLKYNRVPKLNLVIFDIQTRITDFQVVTPQCKQTYADIIGLECVPVLFYGHAKAVSDLDEYLDTESFLGGAKIEGLVVKRIVPPLSAKILSERFKEVMAGKKKAPKKDIVTIIAEDLTTEARFAKARQHLRERGDLLGSMEDIRHLLIEVGKDVKSEETEFIKDKLFKWAWPLINKAIIKELPAWYSKELQGESEDNE